MRPRVTASPSNSKMFWQNRQIWKLNTDFYSASFPTLCWPAELRIMLALSVQVQSLMQLMQYLFHSVRPRFTWVCQVPPTPHPCPWLNRSSKAAAHQVVSCSEILRHCYRTLISSVSLQQCTGNETHKGDTANNTHLSRHTSSTTRL